MHRFHTGDTMRHPACQISLILAALAAAPAALAGPDILKCVDRNGHITLTDQPCAPGSSTQRLVLPDDTPTSQGTSGAAGTTSSGGFEPVPAPAASQRPEHYEGPAPVPPRGKWRPPAAKRSALSRDEATLKAAHLQLLIKDGTRQGRLARLD
jgi:hypothetical protein